MNLLWIRQATQQDLILEESMYFDPYILTSRLLLTPVVGDAEIC